MPIGGGFRGRRPHRDVPPPDVPTSPSSLQLDKSTELEVSLKKSLMALEPIAGTKPPSGWTTSSATDSSSASTSKEAPEVKAPSAAASEDRETSMKTSNEYATFSMLPENVLERIFHELPLKCDQRALTLVNKQTFALLLKDLYHTVIVDMSAYPRSTGPLLEMLYHHNPGRQHIRGVVFDQTNLLEKNRPPPGIEQLVYIFFSNLPDNQLEYFSWPADYVLKPTYSLSLWQAHPNLENIELYENSSANNVEVKNALSQMKNVVSLRISPDSEAGLKNVDKVISNIKSIVSLHVDLRTFHIPPDKDGSLLPQKLFYTAVSAALKTNPRAPFRMPLTHLALWNVDLDPSSCDWWVRVLDLARLEMIELAHCAHVENFIAAMATDTGHPQLQSLTIHHHVQSSAEGLQICNALENYLEKESPLSKLVLRIKDLPRVPNWMHVGVHGLQFETLLLDMEGPNGYTGTDIENILGCTSESLRQVGFVTDHTTDITSLFTLINPVTLYLLGSPPPVQDVFRDAERGFFPKKDPSGLPFRLHVVALGTGSGMTCFMRGATKLLRTTVWTASQIDLRDLTKYGQEVDILMGEPVAFGPGGRN